MPEPEFEPDWGRYDRIGWAIGGGQGPVSERSRLATVHETFHKELDDSTAFGGLVSTYAALAEATADEAIADTDRALRRATRWTQETFATTCALLTHGYPLKPLEGYPGYDRYISRAVALAGGDRGAWETFVAIDAAARACMQSDAIDFVLGRSLEGFVVAELPRLARPDERMRLLEQSDYAARVAATLDELDRYFVDHHAWAALRRAEVLTVDLFDGDCAALGDHARQRLFAEAASLLDAAGARTLPLDAHHDALRQLLRQARQIAPVGMPRIGAVVDNSALAYIDGGALDAESVVLRTTPLRALVAPLAIDDGRAGSGVLPHRFVAVARRARLLATYGLVDGDLPAGEVVAVVRRTAFSEEDERLIVLSPVASPDELGALDDVYVAVSASAQAEADVTSWLSAVPPERLSLVLDVPFLPALRRWLSVPRSTFKTATVQANTDQIVVPVIVGRVVSPMGRSALIVVPTSELGSRLFDQARQVDPLLAAGVVDDETFVAAEDDHLQVVLGHVLSEEAVVGPGSWRR